MTTKESILNELITEYGAPEYIRCDDGGQFIAFVVQLWAEEHGVKMAHMNP